MKPRTKKRAKIIYLMVVMVILIGSFTQIDYSDLSWANNSGMYWTIIAMLIVVFGTAYSLIFEKE